VCVSVSCRGSGDVVYRDRGSVDGGAAAQGETHSGHDDRVSLTLGPPAAQSAPRGPRLTQHALLPVEGG